MGSAVKAEAFGGVEAEEAPDAIEKVAQTLLVEDVAEGEHRHAMGDLAEGLDRGRADARGRAVLADELREALLDRLVARRAARHSRRREISGAAIAIIERIVMGDLAGKTLKLGRGLGFRQLLDRLRL